MLMKLYVNETSDCGLFGGTKKYEITVKTKLQVFMFPLYNFKY